MTNSFIDEKFVLKDLLKEEHSYNNFLLENNEKQISQIMEFFDKKEQILALNGFCGVGKSCIADFVCENLKEDVLVLKYTCFETTTIDDLFLAFFEIFRQFTVQGKIPMFRTKTEIFTQKINSYFTNIKSPMIIVLNSFEAILKNNRNDIINFIKNLASLENIKVIITSRKMVTEYFEDKNIINIPILALNQNIYEKYLRANGVKLIGVLSNELYTQTKGYFSFVKMSIDLMKLNNTTIGDFLEKYSTSLMPFSEFIYREALLFVDPVSIHLFRLLTMMRIPLHLNLIKSLHLFNQERINFFSQNGLLIQEGEYIYLKDYVRAIMENQIPECVLSKLHSACIDLYETQLPLKPIERDLKLSRQTMRNEIDYHKMFLPRKPVLQYRDVRAVNGIPVVQKEEIPQAEPIINVENITQNPEESKEEKIKKISFIIEDENILDNIANSIKDFIEESDTKNKMAQENSKLSLMQILNLAKVEEQKNNYQEVIMLYNSALTKKDDDNFYRFLPNIYLYLANIYKKISKWYEALECYTQAQDFYYNAGNTDKINEIKFEIANIYYIVYKHDNAKFIFDELEKDLTLPNELKIKVNLAQAKLCNNINKEYLYYKKSIPLVDNSVDKSIAAELYYKFAGLNDEKNEINIAVNFYKKCIVADSDPNTNRFLTGSFVNLGEMCFEAGYNEQSIKYLTDAMNSEKNPINLYDISMRMAEIYLTYRPEYVIGSLNHALEYALKSNDNVCISEAYFILGDYYYKYKNYKLSLKNYLMSKKFAPNNQKLSTVTNKIETLKLRMSEQDFEQILREDEK